MDADFDGHKRGMTSGEKIVVHAMFGIGVLILAAAWMLNANEKAAAKCGPYCNASCCVSNRSASAISTNKTNYSTNRANPFLTGLTNGFTQALQEGMDKPKK